MKKMKKLPAIFLIVTSSLVACQSVPLPKGDACVAFPKKGYSLCYSMDKDFDESGDVKPEAKPRRVPITQEGLDKNIHFNPDSYASLKAYALKLKARCEEKSNGSL
jgi:hypothetical protein